MYYTDATTMPSVSLPQIEHDFPELQFKEGEVFSWNPNLQTVYYEKLDSQEDLVQLLHEIAHAKLGHKNYQYDIQLIEMERAAWEYAVDTLAPKYDLTLSMDDDNIQDSLDSYRDWLHKRSLCPQCGAVGLQATSSSYKCINCHSEWRVNQAKSCQLKRYQIK